MLSFLVYITPPALFVDTQVYTVVCGEVVGTFKSCIETLAISLIGSSFMYHCTVGVGSPSALQVIVKFCPMVAKYEDPSVMLIIGRSRKQETPNTVFYTLVRC